MAIPAFLNTFWFVSVLACCWVVGRGGRGAGRERGLLGVAGWLTSGCFYFASDRLSLEFLAEAFFSFLVLVAFGVGGRMPYTFFRYLFPCAVFSILFPRLLKAGNARICWFAFWFLVCSNCRILREVMEL